MGTDIDCFTSAAWHGPRLQPMRTGALSGAVLHTKQTNLVEGSFRNNDNRFKTKTCDGRMQYWK